ncbi:MAG: DedA family protein [Phycisphaerae bacterium]
MPGRRGGQGGAMSFEQWPYLGVFLVLLACGLGLPLPEDVPLLTSGVLVHKELASLWVMIPIAMLGVLGGDCVLFFVGRRFGHRVVKLWFFRRVVNPSRLLMAEGLFQRHGIKIVFIGRFLPGLRPMIFMAAGVLKVPFRVFIGVNGLAACISVPTLVVLGKVFGNSYEKIKSDVRAVTHLLVVVILIGVLIAVGAALHRRQKRLMAAAGVRPDISADALARIDPAGLPVLDPSGTAHADAQESEKETVHHHSRDVHQSRDREGTDRITDR